MIGYGLLIARLCLAIVFLYSGVDKLRHWSSSIEEVRGDGLPWPAAFAGATVFTQLVGGCLVATGFFAWLGALLLAYYDGDGRLIYAGRAGTGGRGRAYGHDLDYAQSRVGWYAARILKGTAPADLPVEQSDAWKLTVNLQAAARLGLAIPRPILGRADELIE